MNKQKETPKFVGREIFESALLGNHQRTLSRWADNPDGMFYLAETNPEGFGRYLITLENDLKLFLSPDCVKNQGGKFLKIVEQFVSAAYQKLPEELEEILERILDLVLDYYSPPEKKEVEKTLPIDLIGKEAKETLPSISLVKLFDLFRALRLLDLTSELEDKNVFKEAKKIVSQYYGRLPKDSREGEVLERILNLILDYYSKRKKTKKS